MINAELISKIKDFANEQKELLNGFELQSDFRRGETTAYSAIISFLSTLESEKPMQGLEEEIVKVCDDFAFPLYGLDDEFGRELINKIARHFAQWGAEHLKK